MIDGMRGNTNKAVVGVFTYMDDAISAIKKIKDKGLDYRVYSPVPQIMNLMRWCIQKKVQ